jgi:hypothetical protein
MSKLKYLYVNGESWTAGDGVEKEERWSTLLSDKLGLIEINESKGGDGNDRMVRTTIEWFDNNPDKWDKALVVLGFISGNRPEYWSTEKKRWYSIWQAILSKKPDHSENKEWWERYVVCFLNRVQLNYNLKNQILLLTSFFDSNNIKYLMFFSWGSPFKFKNDLVRPRLREDDLMWEDCKTFNKKWFMKGSFNQYIINKIGKISAFIPNDGHPTPDGHKIWTEKLYKELKGRKVL